MLTTINDPLADTADVDGQMILSIDTPDVDRRLFVIGQNCNWVDRMVPKQKT